MGLFSRANESNVSIVSSESALQKRTVTGTIHDVNGQPVIGATIKEKSTTNGTVSNSKGYFSIDISQGATLVIYSIGYIKQERLRKNK